MSARRQIACNYCGEIHASFEEVRACQAALSRNPCEQGINFSESGGTLKAVGRVPEDKMMRGPRERK